MSFLHRHWLALVAAGLGWSSVAVGQTGTSSTPSGTQGSSSTQGSSLGSPGNSSSVFGSGSGSSSSFNVFSSAPQSPAPDTSSTPTTPTATESTATAGTGGGSSRGQSEAAPSFTVPGFYGQGSTTFFGGSGRLARPKFETSLTFGFGYDDNVTQTPRNTPDVSPGVSQVVKPGKDVVVQSGTAFVAGQLFNTTTPVYTTVRTPDTIVDVPLPTTPLQRVSSLFTRAGLQLEMQSFTRRSLFVLNASGNETYYFNKDKDPNEFSGSLNLTYLYKLTPRLQMTAQLNSAYISQPDLSRPNTPERQTQGDLVNSLARLDVSYRLTPRVSLTLTGNYSGNRYTQKSEQTGDFDEFTTGLELRYLWKPRWTLLAEVRHGITNYLQTTDLDSTTDYLLVGSEFILNPRLSGSFRLGEALKTFDQSGDSQSAPYVESSITYKSTARSSVQWTNRFGFEEPGSPNEERLVYRSTASYNYMFSPKLRGSLAANLVHEITTNDLTDTKFAQDTFEGTLGLEYQWSRYFSLNASYTFTLVNTNTGLTDYYRNRCFLGGQYSF